MTIDNKIDFVSDLISINHKCYIWKLSSDMKQIIHSNCPSSELLIDVFLETTIIETLNDHFSKSHLPIFFSDAFEFAWFACIESTETSHNIYLVGPNSVNEFPFQLLKKRILTMDISSDQKTIIDHFSQDIPIIPMRQYVSFCQMFHYAIHSEKITIADINFPNNEIPHFNPNHNYANHSHTGVWAAEVKLMNHVENGNLNWKETINAVSSLSYGVKMSDSNSLRQAKNSVIIFTAICARAAIRGGLSPSTSYNLNDYYVQSIEHCSSLSEVVNLSNTMYEDYISRVNKIKYKASVSKIIRGCCDYIDLHIYDPLTLDSLSKHIGYSKYYLTRRFKKEMGISLNDYIKERKINEAKVLLLTEELSVLDVSVSLHFSSRNYFTTVFQEVTGLSPSDYKKQYSENEIME